MSAWIALLMIGLGFALGSLPFSVWLGYAFMRKDVRRYGDHNPGATNVFRAGNRLVGLLALVLDISKAAAPVGIAYAQLELRGPLLLLIAAAPPLGHAFSPFLKFRGGKALATVLGVWIGLTNWPAAAAALLFVVLGYVLFEKAGWGVMLGLSGILGALLLWGRDPLLLAVLAAQWLLLAWTHRADLRSAPRLRARWVQRAKLLKSAVKSTRGE